MILGKTDHQKEAALRLLDRKRARGIRKFAWVPMQLTDGRWVWFGHYWEYLRLSWLPTEGFHLSTTYNYVTRHLYEQDIRRNYCEAAYNDLMDLKRDKP